MHRLYTKGITKLWIDSNYQEITKIFQVFLEKFSDGVNYLTSNSTRRNYQIEDGHERNIGYFYCA